jgi:NADPH:quinone reductase-like Zn-dependent oxidoreductase
MKLRYKIPGVILVLLVVALSSLGLVLSHNSECSPAPSIAGDAERMKAVFYSCYGSPDVLKVVDVEKPVPAADEVLVKVHAASVNPLDWHYMRGEPYLMRLGSGLGKPEDTRLGVDFAGTVEAIGINVTQFELGDEVFGGKTGAFGEYVTVREDHAVALKPKNITFEQAASVPIAALTALQALRDTGHIKAGQKVLINGASGGVGTFAVQIAKAFGAEVTGVCSTRNVDMVRSIGADHVIDYTREDYTKSRQRYDIIVDNVGNRSLLENRDVMTPEGILVLIGGPKGNWVKPMIRPIQAMILSPFLDQEFGLMLAKLKKEDLVFVGSLMKDGKVTPVIDRRYPLPEVPQAIRYSEGGHASGKIIIDLQ